MSQREEGNAVVYCEGALVTTNGKTAHGLLRRSERYRIVAVIDATVAGQFVDAVIAGATRDIPIVAGIEEAQEVADARDLPLTHFIVGLAPDGGRLPESARDHLMQAVAKGLHIISGLHDYLSEDEGLMAAARRRCCDIVDIRKPKPTHSLHFFSGKIEEVTAPRIAVLGTDSAVGKRTTAWLLKDNLDARGIPTEMVGTGQTAWLQGAQYGVIFDSLINDFVSGEIEHAVWSAWRHEHPGAIVIEGQGSLMNPAYPGGFEILAAGRPACVVLQHAPGRAEYDGFPGYPIHPIETQIAAIELISGKPVVAVAVNSENLGDSALDAACDLITSLTGLPAVDPIKQGAKRLVDAVMPFITKDATS